MGCREIIDTNDNDSIGADRAPDTLSRSTSDSGLPGVARLTSPFGNYSATCANGHRIPTIRLLCKSRMGGREIIEAGHHPLVRTRWT